MSLQFYFENFDYPLNILYRTTFMDFLSKVGGWMGLCLGASIVSLLELAIFIGYCLAKFFNWGCRKMVAQ